MIASATPLALAGPMGVGKSATGRVLARLLRRRFLDVDAVIEDREGRAIPELFAAGEARFRQAEREAIAAIFEVEKDGFVVLALGGGALEDDGTRAVLRERTTLVHLDAPPQVLAQRLGAQGVAARPLLAVDADVVARLAALRDAREAGYATARLRVETSELAPREAAIAILRALYGPPDGPWSTEPLALPGSGPIAGVVTVSRGGLPLDRVRQGVLLVDAGLPACHRAPLEAAARVLAGGALVVIEQPAGESSKSVAALASIWETLLAERVDKDTPCWVAGGGTITDLGGFAAHTYKRGLPLALLPTTLLAQLDAALGGKNGINVATTKNAAGTIRVPDRVHLDPLHLLTLTETDLRFGLAEALKSGLIGDAALAGMVGARASALYEGVLPDLEEIVVRAASVKLRIVAADLHESGPRRALNLGHTLGHALESLAASRGALLPHGDAVAIGMVFAARLARRLGVLVQQDLPERVHAAVDALGLPARAAGVGASDVSWLLDAIGRDKKRQAGQNIWVLPVRIGEVIERAVAHEDARAALVEFVS